MVLQIGARWRCILKENRRIVKVINNCWYCPNYYHVVDHAIKCRHLSQVPLGKIIKNVSNGIPDWCPLEKYGKDG